MIAAEDRRIELEVFTPGTFEDALEIKHARPDCVPIAGGTDLMVELNFGRLRPPAMMDLSRIDTIRELRLEGDRLFVGAGVTYTQAMSELNAGHPMATACRTVGSPQIRNRGTIGGNLGSASPAGDALPIVAAMDAEVEIARQGSVRMVPWRDFLIGPKKNCLEPEELIVGVRWRPVRGPGTFSKIGIRNAMVISVASLCLVLDEDERRVRVAVGSVAPTVIRLQDVERAATDLLSAAGVWDNPESPVAQEAVEQAGRLVEASISPIDDARGTAAYRRHACGVLFRRAFGWALDELRTGWRQAC